MIQRIELQARVGKYYLLSSSSGIMHQQLRLLNMIHVFLQQLHCTKLQTHHTVDCWVQYFTHTILKSAPKLPCNQRSSLLTYFMFVVTEKYADNDFNDQC